MSEQNQEFANSPKAPDSRLRNETRKILGGFFFVLFASAVCAIVVYFLAMAGRMSLPKATLFLFELSPLAVGIILIGHWWSKIETEKRVRLKAKILEVLKDYLELLRNFAFASSLLVVGGIVFYEHGLVKNQEVALRILDCFVCASMLYATVAIYYLHWKHWPKHPAGQVGVLAIAMFLWVGMLQSLTVTAHHIDHIYATQREQPNGSSATKEPETTKRTNSQAEPHSSPRASMRSM